MNSILENISITDAGAEGKAIARLENKVLFVENAVPGDIVDVQLFRKRKKYLEGRAVNIRHPSEYRTTPVCEHFGVCGGCKWQNMKYEMQLFYKQKQVTDAFQHLAKIEFPAIEPIIPSQNIFHYRNKLEFTFSNHKWLTKEEVQSEQQFENRNALGFHIPKMFDKVLDIQQCHLQKSPSNEIRLAVKQYALDNHLSFFDLQKQQGFLRNLIIRTSSSGEVMVIVAFHDEDSKEQEKLLNFLAEKFPEITSLQYVINPKKNDTIFDLEVKTFKGNDCIYEQMDGLKFKIGAKSFYQTNSEQAEQLYKTVSNFADLQGDEVVYDLYTGIGTIANFVAKKTRKVVGIEYIPSAIEDAKENSKINNIGNTVFYAGDIKDTLTDEFIVRNGKPDVVITDPPRVGMHEGVVQKLIEMEVEKIVYVSCNPATQARDLQLFDSIYKVEKVQPVDMFPHTHHVENVVLLKKR